MWSNNKIYLEEIEKNVYDSNIKWEKLKNKVLFITGGTGLIGSLIINTILYANKIKGLNCKIIALVRVHIVKLKNRSLQKKILIILFMLQAKLQVNCLLIIQ